MEFYDKNGRPIAYATDSGIVYLFSGKPVAYISGNSVYSFSGQHLGWFSSGWIRDGAGVCVMYSSGATGGPARPAHHAKPAKGARNSLPAKGARQAKPAMPAKQSGWSNTTAIALLS